MRIIAGSFGGRPLVAPRGRETRPTADRVREALFSILGDVADLDVLDLFAGSGAFGLEALSRGAASATFVEAARPALAALRANIAALARRRTGCSWSRRTSRRALARLAKEGRRFGLVFLDPPYAAGRGAATLAALVEHGLLVPGAWVVLERSSRDPAAGLARGAAAPLRAHLRRGDPVVPSLPPGGFMSGTPARTALFPGTFDPVHQRSPRPRRARREDVPARGHRGRRLARRRAPLFPLEERVALVEPLDRATCRTSRSSASTAWSSTARGASRPR